MENELQYMAESWVEEMAGSTEIFFARFLIF